jgi:hypothetical protein
MAVGVYVPFSAIGSSVALVPMPAQFFPWQYLRRFHAWR